MNKLLTIGIFITALITAGCATTNSRITEGGSQVEVRQIQTREYESIDKERSMRAVIATMQDLGFVIDKADLTLGSVSGTKLQNYVLKMTVIVREQGKSRIAVRANANMNNRQVDDPEAYQSFFASLDKSMFLLRNKVD